MNKYGSFNSPSYSMGNFKEKLAKENCCNFLYAIEPKAVK